MSMKKTGRALLTGGASLLFLAACGSGGDSEESTTLEGAESSLTDTQESREEARAAAKACFDAYGTCHAAGDDHACREGLESCLREVAELPRECEPTPQQEESDGGADEPWNDHDADIEEGHGEHHQHHGKHHHGKPRHDEHHRGKHHCHHAPMPDKALHECREQVEHSLEAGQDPAAVSAAYDQCVLDAFADDIAKLCHKIDELCANANAPADTCDRITSACHMP